MKRLSLGVFVLALAGWCSAAQAHFVWLTTDSESRALLFFGENPSEQDYKLPDAVRKAKVVSIGDEKPVAVVMPVVEEEGFIGRRSKQPVAGQSTLTTSMTYGNYHGTLLKYYCYHYGRTPREPPRKKVQDAVATKTAKGLVVIPSASQRGLCLTVHYEGKPVEGVEATLMVGDQEDEKAKSDRDGEAWFAPPEIEGEKTKFAAIVGHTVEKAGEVDGKGYKNESHYATVTFSLSEIGLAAVAEKESTLEKRTSFLPPLSEPVASFGGAVAGEYLYVDSGHTGKEHAHSKENLSPKFQRIRLAEDAQWESLPAAQPLQGFPLVAHGGKLYRVGGLNAKNAPEEDEDLHSVATFACYDPAEQAWTELAPLPMPRSSHDAVVIGDRIYVVGGWQLEGDRDGAWQEEVLAFDLTRPDSTWQIVTKTPFRRRALAAAHLEGKLLVLGGMTEDREITCAANVFDPATGEWSKLPEFPGEEDSMDGFGISAWNHGGKVYASSFGGTVYALAVASQGWEKVTELETPRFFHRILPGPNLSETNRSLLVVAGASAEGHLGDIELIELER